MMFDHLAVGCGVRAWRACLCQHRHETRTTASERMSWDLYVHAKNGPSPWLHGHMHKVMPKMIQQGKTRVSSLNRCCQACTRRHVMVMVMILLQKNVFPKSHAELQSHP